MIKRICLLNKPPPPPCSYWTITTWMEHQSKLNEKYTSFLHCMSSFESISYKKDTATKFFYFLLFYISFYIIKTDIVFHNFLELHSTLSEKRFLPHTFLF